MLIRCYFTALFSGFRGWQQIVPAIQGHNVVVLMGVILPWTIAMSFEYD